MLVWSTCTLLIRRVHTVCCKELHEHTFRWCSQSSQQWVLRQGSPNSGHCVFQYIGSNIPMFKNNPLFPATIYVLVPCRWRKQVSQNIVTYLPECVASVSESCTLKNIKILMQSRGKFEVMWQQGNTISNPPTHTHTHTHTSLNPSTHLSITDVLCWI